MAPCCRPLCCVSCCVVPPRLVVCCRGSPCVLFCCAVLLVAAVCCVASLVVSLRCFVRVVARCLVVVCVPVGPAVSRGAVLRLAASRWSALCCVVVRCVVLSRFFRCCRALSRALRRCPLPWVALPSGAVCCLVSPRCVSCAVCVLGWSVGVCCCSPLSFVLCASWGDVLCASCPSRPVRCWAALCWCGCVMLFAWSVLFLAPGAAVRCCLSCAFLRCFAVLLHAVPRCLVARFLVLRAPARVAGCPVVLCGLLCGPALP